VCPSLTQRCLRTAMRKKDAMGLFMTASSEKSAACKTLTSTRNLSLAGHA